MDLLIYFQRFTDYSLRSADNGLSTMIYRFEIRWGLFRVSSLRFIDYVSLTMIFSYGLLIFLNYVF